MERPSRLAELTLVSKYYPVANYSYPRPDAPPTPHNSRSSSSPRSSSNSDSNNRSLLGSSPEGASSPPGLIDDRTDSELSGDDDYHYHAHASELWDTFWQPGRHESNSSSSYNNSNKASHVIDMKKQYPALIPSPQTARKRPQEPARQQTQAWPLPDGQPPEQRQRRPSPTYSPFPKPVVVPPRTCSRQALQNHQRSNRCENGFLAPPPTQHLANVAAPRSLSTCAPQQPRTPRPRPSSPISPAMVEQRPATSHASRPATPMDRRSPTLGETSIYSPIYPGASHSSTHLPLPETRLQPSQPRTLRPYKSIAQLSPSSPVSQQPEPHSVFEYDSDSDSDSDDNCPPIAGQSPTLSFFRFHKRGESCTSNSKPDSGSSRNSRRRKASQQSSVDAATAAQQRRRRRKRASTVPLSPPKQDRRQGKQEASPSTSGPTKPRRQSDVLSRMLGRRSR